MRVGVYSSTNRVGMTGRGFSRKKSMRTQKEKKRAQTCDKEKVQATLTKRTLMDGSGLEVIAMSE